MAEECRNELPLPNRRAFVSRRRSPEGGWPVVIDWRRDGSDVTMIQREEAEALVRVIRAELHTIPTDCRDAARTLAREIESQVRPIRQQERIEAQWLLAQLVAHLRPARGPRPAPNGC